MSLDVPLVPRDDAATPINSQRVIAECARRPRYGAPVEHGDGWRITYDDPPTGVRWLLAFDGDELLATVEHARPHHFGEEAIEELVDLAGATDMAPLLDGAAADAYALRHAWEAGNELAVSALASQGQSVPVMARADAHAWWEYTRARESLSQLLGEDVFVPTLVLVLGDDGARRVQRLMSWPDAIPCVLPPCEHVVLLRSRRSGGFDARLAAGFDVLGALASLLTPAPAAVGSLRMLPAKHSAAAAERLQRVRTQPMHSFTQVPPDGFVDEEPATGGAL